MRPVELVVKLGGSFAGSPRLSGWLAGIAAAAGKNVVVVPGGGPFADAVRALQPKLRFDDRAAHAMALMAMGQYGVFLAATRGFCLADSFAAIDGALEGSKIPVWSPWPMLRGAPDVPQNWEVTSDSLALWLAAKLSAARVLVVKHAPLGSPGLLDPAFLIFRNAFAGSVWIACPDDVPKILDPAAPPGTLLAA